jgi:hypothetical protein
MRLFVRYLNQTYKRELSLIFEAPPASKNVTHWYIETSPPVQVLETMGRCDCAKTLLWVISTLYPMETEIENGSSNLVYLTRNDFEGKETEVMADELAQDWRLSIDTNQLKFKFFKGVTFSGVGLNDAIGLLVTKSEQYDLKN